jgi:transcriptional regulator with XRE-family HTH domain
MTEETNENKELVVLPKGLDELSKGDKKAIILKALKEQYDLSDSDAAKLMDVSRQYTNKLAKQERAGTLSPLINLAKRAVKTTLKGEAVGDSSAPKASDVIAAAKMVLDRSDPVIQKVENTKTTYNINLQPDDRDKYLKALGIQPAKVVEAEFEIVEDKCEKLPLPS